MHLCGHDCVSYLCGIVGRTSEVRSYHLKHNMPCVADLNPKSVESTFVVD